ncbi:MBOAT family O-acyltransferase [Butyrivibrio fibrisolvens]|uniref:MBOAT family O-acyltransferase n=1 Tax=Butyrivibrio fibrisolvens TaxID=831 RepID=UPI0020BD9098|nr:MBOAT family O-acyltransferase [Butyrivibrio fibrisolvens]
MIDYACALLIAKDIFPKIILTTSVVLNISVLMYFKYSNFVIGMINDLFRSDIQLLSIILPMGISFYTFKGISYLSDVYRKQVEAERNINRFSAYIIMFPQIMSGPIDSYGRYSDSLKEDLVTLDWLYEGAKRMVLGLSQKVIIANTLGIIVDDIWSKGAGSISWQLAWLCSISYSLQIYFDFAGYSNMAIGIGKMLGYEFSENFNLPYMSKSITEFWRRWHMSLGEWFKKYVYIPLGGNRKSKIGGYINLLVVFLLTGIWHGAAWTFIIWGLLNGILRILEKGLHEKVIQISISRRIKDFIAHVYLILVANFAWVLFRAPDIKQAFIFLNPCLEK